MATPILTAEQYFQALRRWRQPYHQNYLAFYSSQWDGIVTDPALWTVPADDHAVHRGDAAFDAFKCLGGRAYCLNQHLSRLAMTVDRLGIKMPPQWSRIKEILSDLIKVCGPKDVLVRVMVTRGSGSFGPNPYDCPFGLLLITVIKLHTLDEEKYENGVKVITAPLPAKEPELAVMKTTSYLLNVLMKKAAVEAGADYAVAFSPDGFMTESSTENVAVITEGGEFLAPEAQTIYQGGTLTRLMKLAEGLVEDGLLRGVRHQNINHCLALNAAEAFVCSTTTDVLPITSWDGRPIGSGRQGPVAKELRARMRAEYSDPASPFLTEL